LLAGPVPRNAQKEIAMHDAVELSIPAKPELLSLARLTVAAVAARANFDFEEIEDLRLALDELCSRMLTPDENGTLALRYEWSPGNLHVHCALGGSVSVLPNPADQDLSDRILDALVDEHGTTDQDGSLSAWLRKWRPPSAPA